METTFADLRYAIRNLFRARGFAIVAILTLALGIGAPAAMFSVINALMLKPLPFRDPDRLMAIGEFRTGSTTLPTNSLSYPDFEDIARRNRSFENVAAFQDSEYTVTGMGSAHHVEAANVTTALFSVLGVQPALGRAFLPGEDNPGHHVVVLSHAFWRAHFNADPAVINRSLSLGGRQFTIVGVMPPGFQFPIRSEARDLWLTFSRAAEPDDPADKPVTTQRGAHMLEAIGRLRPGVTPVQANADLLSIANALQAEYPKTNTHTGITSRPELEHLIGSTRKPLFILFGAVGLVLLIACANVANLLLAQSNSRMREIAIRSALGATRWRVIRQLITESVVLSALGAMLGIGVAAWSLAAVLRFYPLNLPRAEQIGIDYSVLLFTAALAVLTGILFGLVPALRLSSPNLGSAMRDGGRSTTSGPGHSRLRSGLVVLETALGVMLLVGAGLLIRSLDRLSHTPLGIQPDHLLTANFDLSETRYNLDQQDRFIAELVSRIGRVPGVISAAGSMPLPMSNNDWRVSFDLLDHPVPEASQPNAGFFIAVPGFFETMGIPLLQGRTFGPRDTRNSAPVMVISSALAKKYFPNENPIGRRIKIGAGDGATREKYKTREVIGIVGDIRTGDLTQPVDAAYYIPLPQLMFGPPTLVIRTSGDPASVTSGIRKLLSDMDPESPLYAVKTMEDYLALDLGRARFQTVLLGSFAGIALVLTAIGLYGVIAYSVSQRTHEIGVRMALGAERTDVLRMIMGRGIVLTAAGIGVGLIGAAVLARLLASLLYETSARDPFTYVAVCALLGTVALLASYIPAQRATRVDPTIALRFE